MKPMKCSISIEKEWYMCRLFIAYEEHPSILSGMFQCKLDEYDTSLIDNIYRNAKCEENTFHINVADRNPIVWNWFIDGVGMYVMLLTAESYDEMAQAVTEAKRAMIEAIDEFRKNNTEVTE